MSVRPTSPTPPGLAGTFRDPAARDYLFVALASVLVVAAVMFVRSGGSVPAALLPAAVAVAGLVLRWTGMPGVFLVVVAYLLALPYGFPVGRAPLSDVPGSSFRLLGLLLVAGMVTYFGCQYRLLGLVHQAMPWDVPGGGRKKGDPPPRRPAILVAAGEMPRLLVTAGLCVLAGQVLWVLVTTVRIDIPGNTPFRLVPETLGPPSGRPGALATSRPLHRFLMVAGLAGAAGLVGWLVFWYWRLARLDRDEGLMILLDTGWRENRRELNRQEKWRAWGRRRVAGANADLPAIGHRPRSVWTPIRLVFVAGLCLVAVIVTARMVYWLVDWR